jgi:hypothetical protein
MPADLGELVVIQTGPFDPGIVPDEAERFDQVQARAGIGTKADDVAGILGDFRFVQNHIDHDVFPIS